MLENLITNFSNETLQDFFKRKIPSFSPEEEELDHVIPENGYEAFSNLKKLGSAEYENTDELLVFSCMYEGELSQRSSKKKQFEIAKKALKEDFKDGAVFVFYDDAGRFRFSFIRKHYGDQDKKYTPWRRYTYFVEPDKYNKTFKGLIEGCGFQSLEAIQEAFSVEPLSKDFYRALSHWYFYALTQVEVPNDRNEDPHTVKANAMIRLITRLMFVWFMKQNRLIPDELFDKAKVDELLNYKDSTGSTYYKSILQNLFFATLNTEPGDRKFVGKGQRNDQYGMPKYLRYERMFKDKEAFLSLIQHNIPFINGGLFECLDHIGNNQHEEIRVDCFSTRPANEERLKVPDHLFFGSCNADLTDYLGKKAENVEIKGLVDLLNQYDFTIDENTPYDQEVALDPELLGLVFENLLASYNPETESTARKESGSFYTPREVVDYMVEESLLAYLKQQTGLKESNLKALLKSNDDQPFENQDEKQAIIKALSNLELLDPACGSGAYPMGALQKMVNVLSLLDQDNKMWYEQQKAIALAETEKAYEIKDREERRQQLDDIEQAFDEQVKDPDYARKLYLIENTLHGVDIQPIAIQITKLRFFISLLVDQRTNTYTAEHNLGIMPLPNLETKFVSANFLKHLPGAKDPQLSIGNEQIEPKIKELQGVRHELFRAKTGPTKEQKRNRHIELQAEIGDILINQNFPQRTAEYIKNWRPFESNSIGGWFDPEWMFGLSKFDIVIGNPPYVQLQKAISKDTQTKYADQYKDEGYQTFERRGDIYALFFERGINVLKKQGLICLITSNKWLRAEYGKSLRRMLARKKPLKLIDLGPDVFQSATVDTCILTVQNTNTQDHQLQGLTLRSQNQISAIRAEDMMKLTKLNEESWIILKPEEQSIKEKIERLGTPLKDWGIDINFGIKTGYNPAFIIDKSTKDQLIAEDPKSEGIIRPILRGKDIKRYKAEFADLWLINTHNGYRTNEGSKVPPIDVQQYPAIKRHLDQFWDNIQPRRDQGNSPYNLRNCSYLEEFEKEKIAWKRIGSIIRFAHSYAGEYSLDSTVIMTGPHMKYLVGMLNSKLMINELLHNAPKTGTGDVIISVQALNPLYIYEPTPEIESKFEEAVDQILAKKESGQDTTAEEQQIDFMVYKLYDLTYDEVLVVEPETAIGRGEYEGVGLEGIFNSI